MPSPRTFEALGEATRTRDEHIKHVAELEASMHRYSAICEEDKQKHLAHRQTFPKQPFTPDPALTSTLLYELNSDANLLYTADRYKVPIEELCLWMNRPEVSIRLKAIQSSMAFKLNSSIISRSQQAVTSMARIFDSFNELESDLSLLSGNEISTKNALRNREGLTKAASTLARLKREVADGFPLGSPTPTPPHTPTPHPDPAPNPDLDADQSRAVGGAHAADPASPTTSSAPTTPAPSEGPSSPPGRGAEQSEAVRATPSSPPSPPSSTALVPSLQAHPDALKYPGSPALKRDPLPANHPAILSGAAPSSSSPTGRGAGAAGSEGSASSPPFSSFSYGLGSRLPFTPLTISARTSRPP